jgi:hypothetical protein
MSVGRRLGGAGHIRRGITIVALLAMAAPGASWAPAAELVPPKGGYGYDDTPLLPNSPWRVHDRKRPQPPMVAPGSAGLDPQAATPPASAVVLFNGKDLSQWESGNEKGIEEGVINIAKTGELRTRRHFGDCQLHIEWATPAVPDGGAMNWGNSGVLFLGLYELQIIESHDSRIYADGIAGSLYGQFPPLVNPSRKPGQWQCFDAVFTAPRFDGDKLKEPAYFTVFWNGVLVHDHQASLGPMKHRVLPTYDSKVAKGPLVLQFHNSAVRYRNIWVRPLGEDR